MPEFEVFRDRYDGSDAAKMIAATNLRMDGKKPYIGAPLGDDDDFAVFFNVAHDAVDENLLNAAQSVLQEIREIDNKVQESCAVECRTSGLHPRNFENALVYVEVARHYALFHYFGTGVNTEWDELVEFKNEGWTHVGVLTKESLDRLTQL